MKGEIREVTLLLTSHRRKKYCSLLYHIFALQLDTDSSLRVIHLNSPPVCFDFKSHNSEDFVPNPGVSKSWGGGFLLQDGTFLKLF